MFRLATKQDLAAIVAIYNQNIKSKKITADLQVVSCEDKQDWLDSHLQQAHKYPLWVFEQDGKIKAWCSYSRFYDRTAYDGTTEISFYIDENSQGQGLGRQMIEFLINQMPHYQITTLLAFVFQDNVKSLSLLKHYQFRQFGVLPKIANMGNSYQSLVILGYQTA